MTSLHASIVLDTCIWLDQYDSYRPHFKESRDFIDYCINKNIPLLYAATSIKDVYYLMLNNFKKKARKSNHLIDNTQAEACKLSARACIQNMQNIGTAIAIDQSDIWLTGKLGNIHSDFEDNLILAAAKRANASLLVTNDKELIEHATCVALTPSDALGALKTGSLF